MSLVSRFFLFSQVSLIYYCQICHWCLEMTGNKMSSTGNKMNSKLALNATGGFFQW